MACRRPVGGMPVSNPLPQALASASLSRAAGRSLTSIRSQEELELLDPRRRFLGLVDGVLVLRELALEEEEEEENSRSLRCEYADSS